MNNERFDDLINELIKKLDDRQQFIMSSDKDKIIVFEFKNRVDDEYSERQYKKLKEYCDKEYFNNDFRFYFTFGQDILVICCK